jgi:glutaconate CoA-transferase, subunit A
VRKAGKIQPLPDAVTALVKDGGFVALEGFTHLIPFAAGHRFRDAVEHGWPRSIDLVEHSHAGLANAYVAGASHLPFAVLRGYAGTDLPAHSDDIAFIDCPFTGQKLSAVRAINPDVAIIHAQQADRHGNVQLWGLSGVQKEAVLAAKHAIVTVEEIVDELVARPRAIVLPNWVLDAVCHVPNGAWPAYAADYSVRDNAFYEEWDGIARDRDRFTQWMADHVLNATAPVPSEVAAR